MAVGTLADAQPGQRILDLCAAPGGKTTHLAGRMQGKGVLVANEIHPGRAAILAQSVERMGIANCIVCNETPEHLAQKFPHFFDTIVVDAPCSGEGMFRKEDNPARFCAVSISPLILSHLPDSRQISPGTTTVGFISRSPAALANLAQEGNPYRLFSHKRHRASGCIRDAFGSSLLFYTRNF